METPAAEYRCPGEPYPISREIHLGRLATFYARCGDCEHRHDTGVLSPRTVERLQRSALGGPHSAHFGDEAVEGVYRSQITPPMVRELGAALGVFVGQCDRDRGSGGSSTTSIVLASDGRASAPELMAAASEGLRSSGCRVVELAPATAAILVHAMAARNAGGGLLIGHPSGGPATVGIKFWGRGGRPLSSPGSLDPLRTIWEAGVDRPTRKYAGQERFDAETAYIDGLRQHFHALRPLRIVLATTCGVLRRQLQMLLALTACEIVPGNAFVVTRFIGSGKVVEAAAQKSPDPMNRVTTRGLTHAVQVQKAHFGLSMDGDGEQWRVVDERGRDVAAESLVALLAKHQIGAPSPHNTQARPAIVFESGASDALLTTAQALGLQIVPCDATREDLYRTVSECNGMIGGDSQGRIVFGDRPGAGDALCALALLLTILSASDRPLSAVVDDLLNSERPAAFMGGTP